MEQFGFDIIIIGAGANGLMAAWDLVQTGKKVLILEARDRPGGRIHTINDPNFQIPVELGAEFIHGNLELTLLLLKKAGIKYHKVGGVAWRKENGRLEKQEDFIEDFSELNKRFKELKEDMSVSEFCNKYLQGPDLEELRFSLKNYVEGYYAGDPDKVSTFALKEELTKSDDEQYRIEGGYVKIIDFLHQEIENAGGKLLFDHPVKHVDWEKHKVIVRSGNQNFSAKKLLVTVPIGVLQSGLLKFSPIIQEQMNAIHKLGFGPVVKTLLQFEKAFWKDHNLTDGKDMSKLGFLFSESIIPTWWTQQPKDYAMLVGWSGGIHASKLKNLNKEQILEKALYSLSEIFNLDIIHLQQMLKSWHVADWLSDPFCCGGYSYDVVNGNVSKNILNQSVDDTIYFSGEGLFVGPEIGTVEAALVMGRETAYRIIAKFDQ